MESHEPAIKALEKIYTLYDETIEFFKTACRKKCSACCTCNVTLTRLECLYLTDSLDESEKIKTAETIRFRFPEKRYIPKTSLNRFAVLCAEGHDIPEEENNPEWGKCPLLKNDTCMVYDKRPFNCRAMVSKKQCSENGYADIPDIVLTINHVFAQIIEHIDHKGFSANLSDMILMVIEGMEPEMNTVPYEKLSVLMIPPGHKEIMMPVLKKLSCIANPIGTP